MLCCFVVCRAAFCPPLSLCCLSTAVAAETLLLPVPVPLPLLLLLVDKETMVHSGFLSAYDSVKVKVLRLVDQLTADASPERPWKVFVTGHSLGGALATLAAYDLTARRWAGGLCCTLSAKKCC